MKRFLHHSPISLKPLLASILMLVLFGTVVGTRAAAEPLDEAKALFAQYVALEQAYDSRLADLYDDAAVIEATVTYSDGLTEKVMTPAPMYKAKLRQLMSLAQQKGDRSQYRETRFTPEKTQREGEVVIITAQRQDLAGGYAAPLTLVVGQRNGKWVILAEHAEIWP